MTDRDTLCSTLTMAAYQQLCFALVHPTSAEAAKSKLVLWGLHILEQTLKAYLRLLYILFPESGFSGLCFALTTSIFPMAYAVTLFTSHMTFFYGRCAESKAMLFQLTVTSCHSDCLNKICD